MVGIESRVHHLNKCWEQTPHIKKRRSIEKDFLAFLGKLPHRPVVGQVTGHDIKCYLVYKDKDGKTLVHDKHCPFMGKTGFTNCKCPKRLTGKSVQNLVQQLSAIYDEWSERDKRIIINPVKSSTIQAYVKSVKDEQARAHVVVKQAKPVFVQKIAKISGYIDDKLQSDSLNMTTKYLLSRDQCWLKLQFFGGDRAGDLSHLKMQEILSLPTGNGYVINRSYGKTLRGDGDSNCFAINRCKNDLICPVLALDKYVAMSKSMGVFKDTGFVFRPVTESTIVLDERLTYDAMSDRFKYYLRELGIDEGETLHGIRAGTAISLLLTGASTDPGTMMSHVGWFSNASVNHYTRASTLWDLGNTSSAFSDHMANSSGANVQHTFSNFGDVTSFSQAFI